jgi:hypothetical protein
MLLKTNVEEIDISRLATMLLKISELCSLCQDVDENTSG